MIVRLTEEAVRAAFDSATSQEEYLVAVYRLVFPDWDNIVTIGHWPTCNSQTWKAICRMAMDADRRLGLAVLHGGAWLNHGFTSNPDKGANDLRDWHVCTDACEIVRRNLEVA